MSYSDQSNDRYGLAQPSWTPQPSVLVHVYVFFYGRTDRGQKTMWGTPLTNPRRTSVVSENPIPSPFDLDSAVNRAKVIRSIDPFCHNGPFPGEKRWGNEFSPAYLFY